jgi:arylsulfatase A-like enzyme
MSGLRLVGLAVAVLAAASVRAGAPNFLVVVADDMRADAIRAHGGPPALTPVLDRLVRTGFSFRHAYCLGSNSGAVCLPSRAMLMTGRPYFAIRNDLQGQATLPETLGRRGYQTFIAGKWHNGRESCERSFASGEAVFLGGMTDQFHPTLSVLQDHRLGPGEKSEVYSTDAIAAAAVRFLARAPRDQPFFAWVSFTVPHDPRTPPTGAEPVSAAEADPPRVEHPWRPRYDRPFAHLHDPSALRLPVNFLPQHPFDNGWLTVRDEQLLAWPRDPAAVRRELAAYHGLITHLDARVGDLMAALEASGVADNTYVIFLSDHGLALGSHGLLGKQNLYEHSMRAPLVVRGPGVPAGRESHALVYLHDVHATVRELSGQAVDRAAGEVESRSLVPRWHPPAADAAPPAGPRSRLLLAFTETTRAVRTDRWKLIRHPQVDVTQLFDLENDPGECTNLADGEPGRVAELRRELEAAQQAAGDALPWTAATLLPSRIDLTGRARDPFAARPWDQPPR